MDVSPLGQTLPVACTLGPTDGPARLQRWRRLHEAGAPTARVADGVLEVRYRADRDVRTELESLVAAERECCAFVGWAVVDDGGQPVLRVSAPPGAPQNLDVIAALFTGGT